MTVSLGVNWNTSTSVKCYKKKGWRSRIPVSLSQNAWKHDSGWPASIQKWKFGFIKLPFTYCSFCLWTGQKNSWEFNWDEKHLLSPCSWFWPTLENWVSEIMSISISFSGRCPKGWQDGVDEGLGCIWAEVFLFRSYSVPSIYHLLQTNKGTSGIITCIWPVSGSTLVRFLLKLWPGTSEVPKWLRTSSAKR